MRKFIRTVKECHLTEAEHDLIQLVERNGGRIVAIRVLKHLWSTIYHEHLSLRAARDIVDMVAQKRAKAVRIEDKLVYYSVDMTDSPTF